MIVIGRARTMTPHTMAPLPTSFPATVTGTRSPYPTVAIVTTHLKRMRKWKERIRGYLPPESSRDTAEFGSWFVFFKKVDER